MPRLFSFSVERHPARSGCRWRPLSNCWLRLRQLLFCCSSCFRELIPASSFGLATFTRQGPVFPIGFLPAVSRRLGILQTSLFARSFPTAGRGPAVPCIGGGRGWGVSEGREWGGLFLHRH